MKEFREFVDNLMFSLELGYADWYVENGGWSGWFRTKLREVPLVILGGALLCAICWSAAWAAYKVGAYFYHVLGPLNLLVIVTFAAILALDVYYSRDDFAENCYAGYCVLMDVSFGSLFEATATNFSKLFYVEFLLAMAVTQLGWTPLALAIPVLVYPVLPALALLCVAVYGLAVIILEGAGFIPVLVDD